MDEWLCQNVVISLYFGEEYCILNFQPKKWFAVVALQNFYDCSGAFTGMIF